MNEQQRNKQIHGQRENERRKDANKWYLNKDRAIRVRRRQRVERLMTQTDKQTDRDREILTNKEGDTRWSKSFIHPFLIVVMSATCQN